MDNLTQNVQVAAEAAEAENKEAATALGKFKDVQTLMKAYSDLEAEFTRRSQRLKELEKENKAAPEPDEVKELPSQTQTDEERISAALSDRKVRDAVIGDYLKGLAEKSVPLVVGGGAVTAPKNTPKSVKEAGKLAQQFLNK